MPDVVSVLGALVIGFNIVVLILGYLLVRRLKYEYTKEDIEAEIKRRLDQQRHIVKGLIGEQLAPHMKEFLEKYEPADARFLGGKPIDYIVYKGYSRAYGTDQPIDEVVFLEIKTSKEKKRGLDRNEAKIKDAIEAKRVRHDTITIHVAE